MFLTHFRFLSPQVPCAYFSPLPVSQCAKNERGLCGRECQEHFPHRPVDLGDLSPPQTSLFGHTLYVVTYQSEEQVLVLAK